MNNGVIYVRVSSKEQIQGTSLQSQELACREYAKSKSIKIMRVFVEEGESAKFADRSALLELIEFARSARSQVQHLIVWKVDRFARVVEDYYSIKGVLARYGVKILSVTEPITETPEGKLMETILAGFAQFDNDIRAARTVQGMRRRIQEGIFPWGPPLGYRSPVRAGEKKAVPDNPEHPLFGLLEKAWNEAATGAHTKAEMRRLMTAWGVLTKRGKPLSSQAIDKFFTNRYYAGVLIDPWSGEEYRGRHVPMVTEEVFARVQQIFKARSRAIPHVFARAEFPLRGFVRCGKCAKYLTGSFSKGRSNRYPYYHCFNRRCGYRRSFPAAPIHEEFESFLAEVAPKPDLLEKVDAVVLDVACEKRSLRAKGRAQRAISLRLIKQEGEELVRMRAQQLITNEEFIAHKAALRDRNTALLGRTPGEEIDPSRLSQCLGEIKEPLLELPETWRALVGPKRLRFERLVLPAGFVNGRVRTADLGLLFSLFRHSPGGESTVVALVRESWNQIAQEIRAFAGLFRSGESEEETPGRRVRKNFRKATSRGDLEPELAA